MCSTASDSLKWYMTFLVHPERLWLSKSEINTMITPSPQPLRWANGTINPSSKDASGFAQGMSTHGSPDTAHGVSHHHGQQNLASIGASSVYMLRHVLDAYLSISHHRHIAICFIKPLRVCSTNPVCAWDGTKLCTEKCLLQSPRGAFLA